MKRRYALLLCLLTLLIGLAGGLILHRLIPARSASVLSSTLTPETPAEDHSAQEGDHASLIICALETASAIRDQNYSLLASYVHPKEGVTFSPSATVDPSSNLTFSAEDISGMDDGSSSGNTYVWGTSSDAATPISMTLADYFAAYVWDKDYISAPQIGVDTILSNGNALENAADAYPGCHYVEFYQPSTANQADWSALKLVYQWYNSNWYLVGVIHSAWSA